MSETNYLSFCKKSISTSGDYILFSQIDCWINLNQNSTNAPTVRISPWQSCVFCKKYAWCWIAFHESFRFYLFDIFTEYVSSQKVFSTLFVCRTKIFHLKWEVIFISYGQCLHISFNRMSKLRFLAALFQRIPFEYDAWAYSREERNDDKMCYTWWTEC